MSWFLLVDFRKLSYWLSKTQATPSFTAYCGRECHKLPRRQNRSAKKDTQGCSIRSHQKSENEISKSFLSKKELALRITRIGSCTQNSVLDRPLVPITYVVL